MFGEINFVLGMKKYRKTCEENFLDKSCNSFWFNCENGVIKKDEFTSIIKIWDLWLTTIVDVVFAVKVLSKYE